jgi:ubiquinone/menaquinone biosynthesis C-methylase UbiE
MLTTTTARRMDLGLALRRKYVGAGAGVRYPFAMPRPPVHGASAMDASGTHRANREYYDSFSVRYEAHRGANDPGGYHELLDQLEAGFVERFGSNRDVLEVGCGTGLVLSRIASFARTAQGVDLSPGMLQKARQRELQVVEGSATNLPFDDKCFDVTCSFKVLAHIPDVTLALAEMARVTRPGGFVIAEFYNPYSLRGLVKRASPPRAIAEKAHEGHVFTRFDSPKRARELAPASCRVRACRGVRIVTPAALVMRLPLLRQCLWYAETRLCDTFMSALGGFFIVAYERLADDVQK